MRVKILYLGGSREQAGCAEELVELENGARLADVGPRVAALHPTLAPRLASVRWARNFEVAEPETELQDGDEIALLPPVAGGAPRARISREPLDPAAVLAEVTSGAMGAAVLFVGTVRDNAEGHAVTELTYEAYEPMASRELERVAERAMERARGSEVAIAHRVGTLAIGDLAVVIAAAAPHRDEAFVACRDAIENLKRDVPIWKREVGPDGASWVGW